MSVIACRITENGYELAADSQVTLGDTKPPIKFSKLFTVNSINVGSVGSCREAMLFKLYATKVTPIPTEDSLLEFYSSFNEWALKKTGDVLQTENAYFLGFKDQVFRIDPDWFISEIKTFDAIGHYEFALAALYLGHTAKEAVEVTTELSIYCELPVKVIKR